MPLYYYHWTMLLAIPGFLLGLWAMYRLRGLYAKYQDVPQSQGYTGAEVAKAILDHEGIHDVTIEPIAGELTDHYDPRAKVLRLSEGNFGHSSLSSIAVAAHEAGHAIQHKQKYAPLETRMVIVNTTSFASSASPIIFFVGLVMHSPMLLNLGIWLFVAVVFFQVVTLPVEFNASARAKRVLADLGFVNREEGAIINKLLGAAALTYVAALVTALLQLIGMVIRANDRRE